MTTASTKFDRKNRPSARTGPTTLLKQCNNNTEVCAADRPKVNPSIDLTKNRLIGYVFDNAGNTTTDAGGQTFIYDAENKQVQVSDTQGIVGQYFYDGDGKRIKKYVPATGETTIFVYDATGKLVAEYSTIVEPASTAKVAYLTNDHLGSPRITTDAIGQTISRHDFRPFGEEIASGTGGRTTAQGYGGQDNIRQKFTGYERDIESELDFAQARYHSSNLGRFSSPDPYNVILEKERGEDEDERADILIGFISNPQRWNMYVYVVNNPLSFTDPDGHKPRTINIFLDIGDPKGVLTPEGLEAWQKWAADAMKKDKDLTINIYQMNANTAGTVKVFLESLKAKDTATIFMGHSAYRGDPTNRIGITVSGVVIGNSQATGDQRTSHSADGVDIQNKVLAVFSCGFGKGFDNITSSNGTAFVSIIQGVEATTSGDATNAAAFRFAKSIATGSWLPLSLPGELRVAKAQAQSGIAAYPRRDRPSVNAGDYVDYRMR